MCVYEVNINIFNRKARQNTSIAMKQLHKLSIVLCMNACGPLTKDDGMMDQFTQSSIIVRKGQVKELVRTRHLMSGDGNR